VRLAFDGVLEDADNLLAAGWTRLRLRACGPAARWLPGDLAVAEATDAAWELTSARAQTAVSFPMDVALTCQLIGGANPVGAPRVLIPALRAGVIVAVEAGDAGNDDALPHELAIVGTGSGAFRQQVLWLLLQSGWEASDATFVGPGPGNRFLWKITTDCRVTAPDGDVFLVRPGQTQDRRDTLEVIATQISGLTAVDGLPLWLVKPTMFIFSGGHRRAAPTGAVRWRQPGGAWQVWAPTVPLPPGRIDISWQEQGLLRARESGIVLPEDFTVKASDDLVTIEGAPLATIAGAVRVGEGRWRLSPSAKANGHTHFEWKGIDFKLRLPTREFIASWDGQSAGIGSTLYLGELDRWVARCDRPMSLLAHVEDRQRRPLPGSEATWSFAEDLPLAAIAGDLAALLRPEGLGSRVVLNFQNEIDEFWYIQEYRPKLDSTPAGLLSREAVSEEIVLLTGRPLYDPTREELIGSYSLVDNLNHRPISLPRFEGPWIVYLRRNDHVLSEPQLIDCALSVPAPRGLSAAMTISNRDDRLLALEAFAAETEQEPSGLSASKLVELAAGLAGLSPATFDIFNILASRPLLAARVMFMAPESTQLEVLKLAEGLPFLWALIGKVEWDQAAQLQFEALILGLSEFMDHSEALAAAAQSIARTRKLLVQADRSLAFALGLDNDNRTLNEVANAFLTRSGDRIEERFSIFRPRLASQLPHWMYGNGFWHALDAPCAAALHAAKRAKLTTEELRAIRQIARRHPRWFAEGFAAFSRGLG
jgi:hypothetical protein